MDRTPSNLLNFLSLSDLETLIQTIVRRILHSELQQLQATNASKLQNRPLSKSSSPR